MSSAPQIISYELAEINGIPVRPSSRDVLAKSIKTGVPVEVSSANDYINLYHVFERMQQRDKALRRLVLVRKQIDSSKWWIFTTEDRKDVPEVELNDGYDPKRGRYKRYAQQLAEGESLTFGDHAEASKARRAWQLYIPKEKRKHLSSHVKKVPRSGKYMVTITKRG